jgi:hypothetical protein
MGLYECITSIITKTTLGILPPKMISPRVRGAPKDLSLKIIT